MNVAAPARRAKATVGQAVNTALARGARSYPDPAMSRRGFVLQPGFLAADDIAAALADVARYADPANKETGVAGATVRDRADSQSRDLRVRQVTGVQGLSAVLAALARSGRIEQRMAELTGRDVMVGRYTVQIDWPDTSTKRGLHVDSHWPPTYKAFVYLTPVLSSANGPFSVIPGSHRDRVKKVRAVAGNYLRRRDPTDLDRAYSLGNAECLLGDAGTAIFADQRLAHAGWPGHTEGTRFMLVAYLYERSAARPR